LLKDYAVSNDIYTFRGDPLEGFKKALEQATNILDSSPWTKNQFNKDDKIKFEIVYDSQSKDITLTLDRVNKIDHYASLFGPGNVPGYLTDQDILIICNLAKELPPNGIFVEVGSFLGKSAVEWAKNLKHLNKDYKIVAIDSYNSDIDILRNLLIQANFDVPDSKTHLEMFQYYTQDYTNIKPLEAFFNQDFVFDQKIAGVFEDSDHTQRTLNYALPYWWERLVPGGILSGHDYHLQDVKVSVDSFALLNDLEVFRADPGSTIWWIKK
jgi:cephalosporin hydroxylase